MARLNPFWLTDLNLDQAVESPPDAEFSSRSNF